MNQGDIWFTKFNPSVGNEYRKERPGVILTSNSLIDKVSIIAVAPLTSKTNNTVKEDLLVKKNSTNNLHKDSIIKMNYITGFDKTRRFKHKIGELKQDKVLEVKSSLKNYFNI